MQPISQQMIDDNNFRVLFEKDYLLNTNLETLEYNLQGGPEYTDKGNLIGILKHSGLTNWQELMRQKFEAIDVVFTFKKLKKNY